MRRMFLAVSPYGIKIDGGEGRFQHRRLIGYESENTSDPTKEESGYALGGSDRGSCRDGTLDLYAKRGAGVERKRRSHKFARRESLRNVRAEPKW